MLKTILIKTAAILFCIIVSNPLYAQITKDIKIEESHTKIICNFDDFSSLHIGYYGTSQNCTHYYIYGFKYKKTWCLVAKQDNNITFLVTNAPHKPKNTIASGSNFLLEGISLAYMNKYLKYKKKKKEEKEIDIRGYYKFNKKGRKAMKGLLLLEYPKVKKDREPIWPFSLLKKKEEEKKEEVQSTIQESVNSKGAEAVEEVTTPIDQATENLKVK